MQTSIFHYRVIKKIILYSFLFSHLSGVIACQLIDNSIKGINQSPSEEIIPPTDPPEIIPNCDTNPLTDRIDLQGAGTLIDPFLICSPYQMLKMGQGDGQVFLDKHFRLHNDIDLTEVSSEFLPIGTEILPFTGSFLGNNYTVANLNLTSNASVGTGLFGVIREARISDINILNFNINFGSGSSVGALVGRAYEASYIKNINATQVTISGTGSRVGGIVGYSEGAHYLLSIDPTSSISGDDSVGGLIGQASCSGNTLGILADGTSATSVTGRNDIGGVIGLIEAQADCILKSLGIAILRGHSSGPIMGTGGQVGGLAGTIGDGYVKYSSSTSNVTGGSGTGGLVGGFSDLNSANPGVYRSYATGTIIGGGRSGGLVGKCYSGIQESFFDGNVSGDNEIGGICGYIFSRNIKHSYSSGTVASLSNSAGGLTGNLNNAGIQFSYSNAVVTAVTGPEGGLTGAIGGAGPTITDSLWDSEKSAVATMCGGSHANCNNSMALSTIEMATPSKFNTVNTDNWSFWGELDSEADQWIMPVGAGSTPQLFWKASDPTTDHPFTAGSGTLEDPYLIGTADEWNSVGKNQTFSSKHFLITNDIDFNDLSFSYKPWVGFSGKLDGAGWTLSNLTINTPLVDFVGLMVQSPATNTIGVPNQDELSAGLPAIKNLKIDNFNITGKNFVSGLVANNSYTEYSDINISNTIITGVGYLGTVGASCSNLDRITVFSSQINATGGGSNIGGVCGQVFSSHFKDIQSEADVNALSSGYVGGLFGAFSGNLNASKGTNSHSTGNIIATGSSSVGGLIGNLFAPLDLADCYFAGSVSGITEVGGLFGKTNNDTTITNSYFDGDVTGTTTTVGGLVGTGKKLTLNNVFVTAASLITSTTTTAGSFIGSSTDISQIENSYSLATMDGGGVRVGGLVGESTSDLTIKNSYFGGQINNPVGNETGGIIGFHTAGTLATENVFWNITINPTLADLASGSLGDPLKSKGETATNMKLQSTYENANWNFTSIWKWVSGENNNFPQLN